MSQQITRTSWLAVIAASICGFGLLLAPAPFTDRIRSLVRDAAFPGLQGVDAACELALTIPSRFEQPADDESPNLVVLAQRDEWQQRCRELQAVNARLTADLAEARKAQASPFLAEPGTPLFVPELVAAKIIGAEDVHQATQRISFRRVVAAGAYKDIIPSDYVVNSPLESESAEPLLIDQGDDGGVRVDQPVFAGRCVVGKIGQVGRWTSTVIPVTDAAYRGRAQLVRSGPRGLVLGPEGVLVGTGDGTCRLTHIPATEPVGVGDEVYTSIRLTGLPLPMYYGRVARATLAEGAPHWEILVEPAETMEQTRVVQVLRSVLNADRTVSKIDGSEDL